MATRGHLETLDGIRELGASFLLLSLEFTHVIKSKIILHGYLRIGESLCLPGFWTLYLFLRFQLVFLFVFFTFFFNGNSQ